MFINFYSKKFFKVITLSGFICLVLFEINLLNKKLLANTKPFATAQDVYLYKQMGASYLCKAISDKIGLDFPKAFAISTITFAEVVSSKHGGVVESADKEKLSNERLIFVGELEILSSALKICPGLIPKDVKNQFEKTVNNLKKLEQNINKKK